MAPPRVKQMKFWDGRHDHPFFALLSERINNLGFFWHGVEFDAETGVAAWRRPLFDGYELELSLMADDARLPPGYFGFTPTLYVVSDRQAEVWNNLRLWECLNLVRGNRSAPKSGAATIVVTWFRWLIRAWHEPQGTAPPVPAWHRVRTEEASACAEEVGQFLDRHLPRFLTFIATPEALAHTMLNFETFPGNDDGNGPGSACRSVYTAILLSDLGRADEALKELDLEERQVSAKVHGGLPPEYLEVARCQTARLTQWMRGR